MANFFRFQHLNLSRNPFSAMTREEWAEVVILPPAVEVALKNGFDHLQILGDKGQGKTSTLLGLQALTGGSTAYERIPQDKRTFHTALAGLDVFFLDEAQRLNPVGWWRLFMAIRWRGLRLVIGSHRDHTAAFARRGWRLVTVEAGAGLSTEFVGQVFGQRIAYFTLDPDQPYPTLTEQTVEALIARYGNDLRAMDLHLYEVFQRLDAVQPVTPDHLRSSSDRHL